MQTRTAQPQHTGQCTRVHLAVQHEPSDRIGAFTYQPDWVALRAPQQSLTAAHLKGGRVQRTTTWVQPSEMAWRKGTASNTAPSTSRRPLRGNACMA